MGKSELKRQCTQNPFDAADRIAELEQRVKVLQDGLRKLLIGEDFSIGYNEGNHIAELLNQTPQQTAEQIECGHIEWMMKLPACGEVDCVDSRNGWNLAYCLQALGDFPMGTKLVAIPKLPEAKE